ncbi:MAG: trypsin-like peptidase domain-containing protein [Myxococcota bacterium]
MVSGIVAMGLTVGGGAALAEPSPPPPASATAQLWTEKAFAKPLDPDAPVSMRAFSVLAKELSPAVVNISIERQESGPQLPFFNQGPSVGLGSGFIIDADGYVLTNDHVVEEAKQITVKLANDHEYTAKVVGQYRPLDVALLKFDPKEKLTVAPLGSSDRLEIGEWVIAIGNPFGLAHTVTAGIVSAKGRRDIVPSGEQTYAGFIQTDASINPGNSGGPLINIRGEVVGINTAINPAGQGIGFAVPIDMVKTVVAQLAKGKVDRSYLGVRVAAVPRDVAEKLGDADGHPTGALVKDVVAGSPAAKVGIENGDVIVSWNGKDLEDWHDLPWLASTAGAEQQVTLVVNHAGKVGTKTVKLAPFPEEAQTTGDSAPAEGGEAPSIGMSVESVAPEARTSLGLGKGDAVAVKSVEAGSVAEALGMKPGDVITQVNYQPVKGGPEGFAAAVARVGKGEILAFTVRRGDRFLFKAFTR